MTDAPFQLDEQLAKDTIPIATLPLCQLLMMNDAHYPWFILVPQRVGASEIFLLNETDQQQFLKESSWLAAALQNAFNPIKINIAALGNVVRQLHIHHVARFESDAAWPAPIWGKVPPQAMDAASIENRISQLKQHVNSSLAVDWQ